ncbi:MAG: hypothetical protein HYT08_01795 [Candidatus Levybacteria bacterium]|nr:hypothetical protein [Candidatus Levybacteria bacterium]
MGNKVEERKSQASWEDRMALIVPRASIEKEIINKESEDIEVLRINHSVFGLGWEVRISRDSKPFVGYQLIENMGLLVVASLDEIGEQAPPGLSEEIVNKIRRNKSNDQVYIDFTQEERVKEANNIIDYVEKSREEAEDNIIITSRAGCLKEGPKEGADEQAMQEFFQTLAAEPSIAGIGLSRMKMGGLFVDVFVKDFNDAEAMGRVGDVVESAFEFLDSASNESTGYHSFTSVDGQEISEFAEEFKRQFDTPISPEEVEKNPLAVLRTSIDNSVLLGIVIFED